MALVMPAQSDTKYLSDLWKHWNRCLCVLNLLVVLFCIVCVVCIFIFLYGPESGIKFIYIHALTYFQQIGPKMIGTYSEVNFSGHACKQNKSNSLYRAAGFFSLMP